jgi:hypothetical protein
VPRRSTAQALAWAALAGQLVFVAAWIVAGALEPHYSHVDQGVSELAARTAAHPLIVGAGIVVLGLAFAALGCALPRALPRRRAATIAGGLFVAGGSAVVLSGVFRLDCGPAVDAHCRALWRAGSLSWHQDAHVWSAFAGELLLAATPFAIAAALWPAPSGALALGAGASGLVLGGLSAVAQGSGAGDGLAQRFGLGILHLWAVIVAIGILHVLRRPPRLSALIPLRPRDFLARSWTGTGELIPWPYVLGRRLARPFEARREATWLSERVWRIDDEARFADGRVLRRQTFCEFVAGDHVHLTAGDLPDGADVWLQEGGYRIAQFRMAFPIGPVPVYIRCRDLSYLEGDGAFANVFEARSLVLGLPMARLVFHVRPAEEGADEGPATAPREVTA